MSGWIIAHNDWIRPAKFGSTAMEPLTVQDLSALDFIDGDQWAKMRIEQGLQ
jgi:hypothetical protein